MDREQNDLNPETADEVLAEEKRQRAIQIMKDTKNTNRGGAGLPLF